MEAAPPLAQQVSEACSKEFSTCIVLLLQPEGEKTEKQHPPHPKEQLAPRCGNTVFFFARITGKGGYILMCWVDLGTTRQAQRALRGGARGAWWVEMW